MKKATMTIHPDFRIGGISGRLFGAFLEPIGSMVNGSMVFRFVDNKPCRPYSAAPY